MPDRARMQRALFLTWIAHQRTRNLAERLDLPLIELLTKRRGLARYAELLVRTLRTLSSRRPAVLIAQTPSQILAVIALLMRTVFRYRLVLDAHNEAVEPYLHRSRTVLTVTNWLLRRADLVIVSNRQLADVVTRVGGRPLILPDALPRVPAASTRTLNGPCTAVVISTYAGDEPIAAVFEAARAIGPAMHFYLTGNAAKCPPALRATLPENVTLTGFLSEPDYWSTLASCDIVIDLTTMDNCLVCGAYEAIALGKPLLLSRNQASVDLFTGLADFTQNEPQEIAAALLRLRTRLTDVLRDHAEQRRLFEARWAAYAAELTSFVDATVTRDAVRAPS